jgi:hypothetical protein
VDLAYESEVMYREGPEESAQDEPTFAVVVRLTAMCHARFAGLSRTDLCKAPWERSYRKGVAALGVLMEEIADAPEWNAHRVEATMLAFEADVRRAIAYRALYAARDALVKVAETAGLFVIGGRQPVRGLEGRGWVRRIGNALWQFEVTEARPLEKARGGLIVATLVAPGAAKERHALPRRFEYGPHRAAEDAALERI